MYLAVIRSLLALLLLAIVSPVIAQAEPWYQLELILFSHNSPTFRDSERWPEDLALPNVNQAISLSPPLADQTTPTAFAMLDVSAMQLLAEAERIEQDESLRLLAHLAWLQPGLPAEQAKAVWIAIPDPEQSAQAQEHLGPPVLEGTLSLSLSRYLHLAVDLLYREAKPNQGLPLNSATSPMDLFQLREQPYGIHSDAGQWQLYRKEESRRMRSNELHYLDHPMFGMLVLLTPHQIDQQSSQ
ncbi:MAG: CsiV family protein [Thiohalomonadaceae bacterium]